MQLEAPGRVDLDVQCSTECRESQRRLDVRVQTSLFAARSVLLWAFQNRKKQLQAIYGQCSSLFHATAAQRPAFGSHFGSKQRQIVLSCSRMSVTIAVRLLCFQIKCPVTHPLRRAACILSRRHVLPGCLGEVAALGAGFMRAIGSPGVGNGQFEYPSGAVAFDGEGNLVVNDGYNNQIQVFRYIDGVHLRTIGQGNVQFNQPCGIAFDGAGHIIVSETGGNCVQVLRYIDGAHVRTIGSEGSSNGQFSYPTGIAIDGAGNIAVFDGDNARVQVHRLSDGAYIRTIGNWGSANGLFRGSGIGIAFDGEGNLVVADRDNHRVQVLRYSDGTLLRIIGRHGTGAGQFQFPSGIAFDAVGHIVVVDQGTFCNERVQVLRYSNGAHVRTICSHSSDQRLLHNHYGGIAIDSNGCVVVADIRNHRVEVLG